jgi:hypothetical protein
VEIIRWRIANSTCECDASMFHTAVAAAGVRVVAAVVVIVSVLLERAGDGRRAPLG